MAGTGNEDKGKFTASLVGACVANDAIHKRFMNMYATGTKADIKTYLMTEFGLPSDLADDILAHETDELSDMIGKLICDWLW